MPVQKTPLASIKNTANGVAGLDGQSRVTSPIRGRVSILDYGADPTGVADCASALASAIAEVTVGTGYYVSGAEIHFPPGTYRFDGEINLKKTVKLVGAGSGLAGGQSTRLTFPADSRGIIIHRYNTLSNGVEAVPTTAADGSILQGLELVGSGTSTTAHGVWMRARAIVRDCVISGFGGNGLHIVAGAGFSETEPAMEGNANNWHVDNIRCQGNGEWGVFVDGPDANAGLGIGVDCSGNGSGGFFDSSFLGNTYIGCHTATNGSQASGKNATRNRTSLVWYSGMRYYAAPGATQQQLIDTTPGTNAAVWVADVANVAASGTHPEWLAGQSLGRYFVSDQYRTDNSNARNVFMGCYEEGGYSKSTFVLPTLILGGSMGGVYGGAFLEPTLQGLQLNTPLLVDVAQVSEELKLSAPGDHPTGLGAFLFDAASGDWITQHAGLGARVAARYTTDMSTFTGGRSAAVGAGHVRFPRGAFIGDRMVDYGTAPPSSGSSARGDVRFNTSPSVGQFTGWSCVAGGVNGSTSVWAGFGRLEAL
jgi:hypothetical protein